MPCSGRRPFDDGMDVLKQRCVKELQRLIRDCFTLWSGDPLAALPLGWSKSWRLCNHGHQAVHPPGAGVAAGSRRPRAVGAAMPRSSENPAPAGSSLPGRPRGVHRTVRGNGMNSAVPGCWGSIRGCSPESIRQTCCRRLRSMRSGVWMTISPESAAGSTAAARQPSRDRNPNVRHAKSSGSSAYEITRPGFEPGQTEPKSVVLPLHHRAMNGILRARRQMTQADDWRAIEGLMVEGKTPNSTKAGRCNKPQKPCSDTALTAGPRGKWCQRANGRLCLLRTTGRLGDGTR